MAQGYSCLTPFNQTSAQSCYGKQLALLSPTTNSCAAYFATQYQTKQAPLETVASNLGNLHKQCAAITTEVRLPPPALLRAFCQSSCAAVTA